MLAQPASLGTHSVCLHCPSPEADLVQCRIATEDSRPASVQYQLTTVQLWSCWKSWPTYEVSNASWTLTLPEDEVGGLVPQAKTAAFVFLQTSSQTDLQPCCHLQDPQHWLHQSTRGPGPRFHFPVAHCQSYLCYSQMPCLAV